MHQSETIILALGPAAAGPGREPLREALASTLMTSLGHAVEVRAHETYSDLAESIDEAHFAWLPPAVFVRLRNSLSIVAAVQRGDGASYHGILFGNAPLALEEVRGRHIAWVHPDSSSGHLFVRLLLREAGFSASDLGSEVWYGSHEAVVNAVASGKADIGATFGRCDASGAVVHAGWHETSAPEMHVIGVSKPIPSDVFAATTHHRFGPAMLAALQNLAHDGAGQGMLKAIFGSHHFVEVPPTTYDVVRDALASILEL
ncbi:MAG: PhnD/SsuA/transferrin family substrate-binding protein [Myxococcota bacterium]